MNLPKISAGVGMATWLGAWTVLAQYELPPNPFGHEIAFRPFSVSFGTTSGYDSEASTSLLTKAEKQQIQSSFYAGFTASAAINYAFADSFFGARTSTGYTYYFERTAHKYDTPLNIDSTFSHTFSPRWTMSASDNLLYDNEQQIGIDSQLPNQAQQFGRYGAYYVNNLSIGNSFLLSPRLTLNPSVSYSVTRYSNPASANVLDHDDSGISIALNYLLTSATSVGFSVGYNRSDQPSPTLVFAPQQTNGVRVLVARVNKSSSSESFAVTFNHAFSSRFTVGGFGGLTLTTFEDNHVVGQSVNPAVSVSANYGLDSRTTMTLSYVHALSQTEIANFVASIQDTATLGITRQFSPKISVTTQLNYSKTQEDSAFNAVRGTPLVKGSGSEEDYGGTITTGYSFTRNLAIGLGYNYNVVSSSFKGHSYARDRVMFNVSFTW